MNASLESLGKLENKPKAKNQAESNKFIQPNNGKEKILQTIDKYKETYKQDPESKIFAPLAEAYRKAGQLQAAYDIAQKGLADHPEFASGQVTFARILIDMNKINTAIDHLKLAIEISPDNFLAHKLLGESYIRLRQPTHALQVFKMALYLDPQDLFASKMVKKLESLSAADFSDETIFEDLLPSFEEKKSPPVRIPFNSISHELERALSLIDAYISRNDYMRASSTLTEALDKLGKSPELQRRQIFLSQRFKDSSQKLSEIDTYAIQQVKMLRDLLKKIEDRRVC